MNGYARSCHGKSPVPLYPTYHEFLARIIEPVNTIDPAISSKTRDLEISENFPYAILQLQTNQLANQVGQHGPGLLRHEKITGQPH